jgi:hypothetical protein
MWEASDAPKMNPLASTPTILVTPDLANRAAISELTQSVASGSPEIGVTSLKTTPGSG